MYLGEGGEKLCIPVKIRGHLAGLSCLLPPCEFWAQTQALWLGSKLLYTLHAPSHRFIMAATPTGVKVSVVIFICTLFFDTKLSYCAGSSPCSRLSICSVFPLQFLPSHLSIPSSFYQSLLLQHGISSFF